MASQILGGLLKDPAVLNGLVEQILSALIKRILAAIAGGDKPTAPPTTPVVVPVPNPHIDPDFPDDTIPSPPPTRSVASVRLKVSRIQLSKQRFPEQYTKDNEFGLMDKDGVQGGQKAIPYGSKVWFDLTAFDASGKEFLRDAVLSHGLAFKTEHRIGDALIAGSGAQADGGPAPWAQVDTDKVGHGVTAWKSSLGFLHQTKLFGEGSFECSGSVAGVASNTFTVRSS
jgi:hypothetical protein